jgi:hypothetical protein
MRLVTRRQGVHVTPPVELCSREALPKLRVTSAHVEIAMCESNDGHFKTTTLQVLEQFVKVPRRIYDDRASILTVQVGNKE